MKDFLGTCTDEEYEAFIDSFEFLALFEQGQDAACAESYHAIKRTPNPYPKGSKEELAWEEGYDSIIRGN